MAIYLVGDIQGCYSELIALLEQVDFDPAIDELWPAGDVVARGPDSLATLRLLYSLGDSVKMVLGNHDLHLMAIAHQLKKSKKSDKLQPLLDAPDFEQLIDWLAQQPLVRKLPNNSGYLSHAGLPPHWTPEQAYVNAQLAQQKIAGSKRHYWLSIMYGEQPNIWTSAQTEEDKFRFTINALTRMRFVTKAGELEFSHKNAPEFENANLVPWFDFNPHLIDTRWVFGHWASLMGHCNKQNVFALDTGCVWGGHLTLLRWQDHSTFIENAHS